MRKTLFAALVALAPALFASAAKADVLDFSYTLSGTGNVLSGTMDGTLLSGGNDFDVSSFGSLFVNDVAVPLPFLIDSADEAILADNTPAEVSLNGSYMDLFAFDGEDLLAFAVGDAFSSASGGNVAGATPGYGGDSYLESYAPNNWTASIEDASTPVPEPSSLLLMLAPLALTALLVTSRRTGRRAV
jgi:hypothetical protein